MDRHIPGGERQRPSLGFRTCAAALDALRKVKNVEQRPEFRSALSIPQNVRRDFPAAAGLAANSPIPPRTGQSVRPASARLTG